MRTSWDSEVPSVSKGLNIFPLEMAGVRWVRVKYPVGGVVANARVDTMGRGSNFCHFGAYVLTE